MLINYTPAFLLFIIGYLSVIVEDNIQNRLQEDTVNIGLLIQTNEKTAAKDAAELAISEANNAGCLNGNKFKLITHAVEGLWGTGSKKSVSLVFDDNVLAIIGSLDGRNAHLAEQVTAKTKVAFLSAYATDMTLSSAFVPWYFRCVLNDLQQAQILIDEIFSERKLKRITLIGTESYDSKQAISTFKKANGKINPFSIHEFIINSATDDLSGIIAEIKNLNTEAIVLLGAPELAMKIIPIIKKENIKQPIFASSSVLDNQKPETQNLEILDNIIVVAPNQNAIKNSLKFQHAFFEKYGYRPGLVAAFAYDATQLIVQTIKRTSTNRDEVISRLQNTSYAGVTGKFSFDKNGNRTDKPELFSIKNGTLISLKNTQ